jgi:hypothetical protein
MIRHLAIAVGLVALALPAAAQQHSYDYEDETGSAWSTEPPPPGEGSYSEYPADDARTGVDVNVDMATPDATVTFDTFRDRLSPYGEWVNVPNYGNVWRPAHVAADWRPYYNGRWEWTDEGWLWVSDEPWGWAAYHYGRWAYDPYYSWVWVPGYQWAPAWVTWRYSPDYIGWAPLAPGFSVFVSSYPVAFTWWTFVPCNNFVAVPVSRVAVPVGHVRGIFHAAVPAPPRARAFGAVAPAWGGPARPFVEHRIGRPITPVRLQAVPSPAAAAAATRAGVVPIYRPEVRVPSSGGRAAVAAPPPSRPPAAAPAPGRVMPAPGPGRAATAAPVRPWGGNAGGSGRPFAPQGGARPIQPSSGWQGSPPPGSTQRMMAPAPAGPRFAPGARPQIGGQPQAPRGGGQVQHGGGGAQHGGGGAQHGGGGAQHGGGGAQHGGGHGSQAPGGSGH